VTDDDSSTSTLDDRLSKLLNYRWDAILSLYLLLFFAPFLLCFLDG
jgi:hypothetical protein